MSCGGSLLRDKKNSYKNPEIEAVRRASQNRSYDIQLQDAASPARTMQEGCGGDKHPSLILFPRFSFLLIFSLS